VKQSDINAYLAAAHVTQTGTITEIPIDGGGTYSSDPNSATGEAVLDVETISGLAPAADILVYNVPDLSDQHITDDYNKTVSDNKASVVNSSFGGCEADDTSFASSSNSIAEQAASKGITFAASSGDSGSDECNTGNDPPGPSGPASDPYFVAVGAVEFTQNAAGTLTSIAAGDDPSNGFLSGGGVSTFFALPSYQAGVTNVITSGRNTPDLSLPGVGVAVYQAGNAGGADGTSWSCPEFTALLAETSQLHNGTRFGWVNPTMYSVFKSTAYADFTDVTTGNNGFYKTKVGYDQVTGIGAPKGYAFASAL
jgi:kumamolisin